MDRLGRRSRPVSGTCMKALADANLCNRSIYAIRTILSAYYNFRIESTSARLKEYQEERARTIQKLKDATKYDSTMELIEKYGGEGKPKGKKKESPEDQGQGSNDNKGKQGANRPVGGNRTNMPPPPTANIQRRNNAPILAPQPPNSLEPSAEFAPNAEFVPPAFARPPPAQYPQNQAAPESHWYDRIFDVLLGEDETAPKNRIVLICQVCRLVNGQAPPGTKTLSELGTWKCMSCGAVNGEMDEGKRIVKEVLNAQVAETVDDKEDTEVEESSDGVEVSKEEVVEAMEDDGPAAGVRKRRGKGKK